MNRPISVYRMGEMPIRSGGQSVSAPRRKTGARLNAHTELREGIYRIGLLCINTDTAALPVPAALHAIHLRRLGVAAQLEFESKV
jgi:hypothetical protein